MLRPLIASVLIAIFCMGLPLTEAQGRVRSCVQAFSNKSPLHWKTKEVVDSIKKLIREHDDFLEAGYNGHTYTNIFSSPNHPRYQSARQIHSQMKRLIRLTKESKDTDALKELIRFAHEFDPALWLFHSEAILALIGKRSPFWKSLDWTESHFKKFDSSYLSAFIKHPLDQFPNVIIAQLKDFGFIHLTKKNTVVLGQSGYSPKFHYIAKGRHESGACPHMCGGHSSVIVVVLSAIARHGINTLLPSKIEEYRNDRRNVYERRIKGNGYLVALPDGTIIGAIKVEGDQSMLALKNVMTHDGRLVMIAGNTYMVSRKFAEKNKLEEYPESPFPLVQVEKEFGLHGLSLAVDRLIKRIENREKSLGIKASEKSPAQKRKEFIEMLRKSSERVEGDLEWLQNIIRVADPRTWNQN